MKEKQEGSCGEAADCAPSQLRSRFGFSIFLAAIIIAAVFLTVFTWGKWGDALIDVGRELEIPRKLVEGAVLYRDAAFNYGPFSPYFNATLFGLLGVSVRSLVAGGFLCAAAGAVLVYLLCRRFLGGCASLAMVAVFLLESVFQHYFRIGCFNFILPYSVSAVHAVLFAFGALLFAFRYLDRREGGALVVAGLLAGLCLLCKLEVAVALMLTLAACTLLRGRRVRWNPASAAAKTALWAAPAALVAAGGYLPLIMAGSFGQVILENSFRADLMDVRSNVFFRECLGIYSFSANVVDTLGSIAFWAAGAAAMGLCAWLISSGLGSGWRGRVGCGVIAAAAVLGASWFAVSFRTVFLCLPVACIAVVVVSGVRATAAGTGGRKEDAQACAFGLFALLMMGRILFRARTADYGFFLVLPALMLFGVFLAGLLPRWLRFPAHLRRPYVFLVLLLLVSQSARNFVQSSVPWYRAKNFTIEGANGRMAADAGPRYRAMAAAIRYLADHSGPGETLVVIPEGAAVNFLTGIDNPTPYNLFIPPELAAPEAEERVIGALREKKVDRVLIIDRRLPEYGFRGPGIDYAHRLMKFVGENYSVEAKFGMMPYSHPWREGGAILLRRKMPGVHFP